MSLILCMRENPFVVIINFHKNRENDTTKTEYRTTTLYDTHLKLNNDN